MSSIPPIPEKAPRKEGLVVLPDGTHQHYANGVLHREGAPAVHRGEDREEWYQHGRRHRRASEGPALIVRGVYRSFFSRGKLHNPHGPAVEYESGGIEFWLKGVRVPNDIVVAAVAHRLVDDAEHEATRGPDSASGRYRAARELVVQQVTNEMRAELRTGGTKFSVAWLFDRQIANGNIGRHKLTSKKTQIVRDLLKEREARISRRGQPLYTTWREGCRAEQVAWAEASAYRTQLEATLAPWNRHLSREWVTAALQSIDNSYQYR